MIKGWLKKQLIPEKRNDGLWPGFADTLQSLYEEQVEPILERISNRKSFFSMHSDDLDTRINEYGRFFNIGETGKASRPILLAQRIDEVHFKGTDRPIISTFWREFGNLPVTWEPLYAPVDQERFPYGVFFTTAAGVEIAQESYGEFFLTSRGTINVDLNKLYEIYGYAEQDQLVKRLINDFDRIVAPLLPLEIVFDGITLRLDFWLEESREQINLQQISSTLSGTYIFRPLPEKVRQQVAMQFSGEASCLPRPLDSFNLSLDTMPVDAWRLDFHALIPPILPGEQLTDTRLRISGSKLLIDTLGQWGCVIEFFDGSVEHFAFPGWSVTAVLPFSTAVYPAGIRKITYCSEQDSEHMRMSAFDLRPSVILNKSIVRTRQRLLVGEDAIQQHFINVSYRRPVRNLSRSTAPHQVSVDEMNVDSWCLDFQTIIPPVVPGDDRLESFNGKSTLETLGMWGCLIVLSTGEVARHAFPGWAGKAILPYTLQQITKVTYCADKESSELILSTDSVAEKVKITDMNAIVITMVAENQDQLCCDLIAEQCQTVLRPSDVSIKPGEATFDSLPIDVWLLDKDYSQ